jgi:signal transduction histidine kinase
MQLRNWLRNVKFDPTGELATTIAIAALAVAGPTAGLLWFMHRALQGERQTLLAERATTRKNDVLAAKDEVLAQLVRLSTTPVPKDQLGLPPGPLFKAVVDTQLADSCLIYDSSGRLQFPVIPYPSANPESPTKTTDAEQALREFHQPSNRASDGWPQLTNRMRGRSLLSAVTPSGRVYQPQLMVAALEEMEPGTLKAEPLIDLLKARVLDYDDLSLPSTQRIYLVDRLHRHAPQFFHRYIDAERLAVTGADGNAKATTPGVFEAVRTTVDLYQVRTEGANLTLLYKTSHLKNLLTQTAEKVLQKRQLRAEILTAPPTALEDGGPLAERASMPLGRTLRGWFLIGHDDLGIAFIDSLVERRRWNYTAIAIGGGLLLNVLAALAIQRFTRSASLTQARQDFLSVLSHELRTPLTSIRMFVDTLADGGLEDPTRARTYLDFIRRENERLSRLTENFLTFTRLESGRMNFDLQEISPEEIVESARVATETRFSVQGTDFQLSVERRLPMIMADHTLMTTAVVNLLENAFKYTPPDNKRILLSVARGHNTVRFTVADNGQGLNQEEMKRLGQKFYRPDAAARSGQPGFGLGLNIVSHIIQAHKGRLEIHTEPGVGSRFTLILPAVTAKETES